MNTIVEQDIKLIDFDVDNMKYTNMLAISNLEQLEYYHNVKQKRCENDFANVLTTHLGDKGRSDLYDTAAHYADEGMTTVAMFISSNAFESELKMNTLLSDQYRLQAVRIIEGNTIVINSKGGYHWRNLNKVKVVNETTLTNKEVKDFIYKKYNKKMKLNSIESELYFVIDKAGKVYFDTCVYRHDSICDTYDVDCDSVIKLMYYKKDYYKHEDFCSYGIQGLRLSNVYDKLVEPFAVKNNHLNSIEKFIKRVEVGKG